jgi:hypothetical protein
MNKTVQAPESTLLGPKAQF